MSGGFTIGIIDVEVGSSVGCCEQGEADGVRLGVGEGEGEVDDVGEGDGLCEGDGVGV